MKTTESQQRLRDKADELLVVLAAAHPKCFVDIRRSPKAVKPLKVGIDWDIRTAFPMFSVRQIKAFLALYTRSKPYRNALLVPDAQRVGLDGEPTSAVKATHAEFAKERLARGSSARPLDESPICLKSTKRKFATHDDARAFFHKGYHPRKPGVTSTPGKVETYTCRYCGSVHLSSADG